MRVHSSHGFQTAFLDVANHGHGHKSFSSEMNGRTKGSAAVTSDGDDDNLGRREIDSSPSLSPPVVISRIGLSPIKTPPRSQLPGIWTMAASARPVGQKRILLPFPTAQNSPSKVGTPVQSVELSRPTRPVPTAGAMIPRSTPLASTQPSIAVGKMSISCHLPLSNALVSSAPRKSRRCLYPGVLYLILPSPF